VKYFKSKITKKLIDEAKNLNFGKGMTKRDNMMFYMVYQSVNTFLSKVVGKGRAEIRVDEKKVISKIFYEDKQVVPIIVEKDLFDPDICITDFSFSTKGLHCHNDDDIFLFIVVNKENLEVYFLGCLDVKEVYNKGDFNIFHGIITLRSTLVKDLKKYFV